MYKFLSICVAILLASTSFAEDTDHPLKPLENSFQLKINGIVSVSGLNGCFLSYKKQFSSTDGIRFGIGLSGSSHSTVDSLASSQYLQDILTSKTASSTLSINYIHYPMIKNAISFYYGIGPLINLGYNYSEQRNALSTSYSYWNRAITYGIGANGLIGLEWFFYKQFSIFTEYDLNIVYSHMTQNSGGGLSNERISINKGFDVNYNQAFIGLSIYL